MLAFLINRRVSFLKSTPGKNEDWAFALRGCFDLKLTSGDARSREYG